jgi:hypothetical protein
MNRHEKRRNRAKQAEAYAHPERLVEPYASQLNGLANAMRAEIAAQPETPKHSLFVAMKLDGLRTITEIRKKQLPNDPLACQPGCHMCCTHRVEATPAEAQTIAEAIVDEPELQAKVRKFAKEYGRKPQLERIKDRVFCPFLTGKGMCGIYEIRPAVCAKYHSLDVTACFKAWLSGLPEAKIPMDGDYTHQMELVQIASGMAGERGIGELTTLVAKALDHAARTTPDPVQRRDVVHDPAGAQDDGAGRKRGDGGGEHAAPPSRRVIASAT